MGHFELAAAEWTVECGGVRQQRKRIKPGLYVVHWKDGGISEAAIGCGYNGDNWIAPTNWIRTSTIPKLETSLDWGDIDRLERINAQQGSGSAAPSLDDCNDTGGEDWTG